MRITATIKEGWSTRPISLEVPTVQSPLMPAAFVDPRWVRPYVFHNFSIYPFSEATEVQKDFETLVNYVNSSARSSIMERYLDGLNKTVDSHIARCGRILFCDLLMYVDCLAYLCYASDLMTEKQINEKYPYWVKSIVDCKEQSVMCSTRWGAIPFSGSNNDSDLKSCFP